MENNIVTKCIEFYGLPGCGKSTVSHELVKVLLKQGYSVIEPIYILDHKKRPIIRKILKITATIKFIIKKPLFFKKIIKIILRFSDITNTFSNIISFTTKFYYLDKYHGKVDFIVFDEGIIQGIVSIMIDNLKFANKITEIYFEIIDGKYRILPVYIDESVTCSLKNMNKRETNDSRVEKIKDNNKKANIMNRYLICFTNIHIKNTIYIANNIRSIKSKIHFILNSLDKDKV